MTTPCQTFCTRFILRVDGHRCADCGMTVGQARKHHEPKFEVRPPSVIMEPAYQAWQDWYWKTRGALRFGAREVDVRCVTEADTLAYPDEPPVYALRRKHHGWEIVPRDHETTSWPMFIPVFEQYLPEGDSVRGYPVQFAKMNKESTPGFIFMTFCTCGWFRPASWPTCTQHAE